MPNIIKASEPFPYLIVKNWYTPFEYELIWKELDLLSDFNKLDFSGDYGAKFSNPDNSFTPLSNHKHLYLKNVFKHEHMSNIRLVTKKLFASGILSLYGKLDRYAKTAQIMQQTDLKIGYYENQNSYAAHADGYNFTCISYFYKEPRKFTGGSLKFIEDNFEYDCDNNSLIIFPSHIKHQVDPISFFGDPLKKEGRFYISQFLSNYPEQIS